MKRKKFIIYARSVVQENNGDNSSIDKQLTELIKYAQQSNLEIIEVITEYGSGTSFYRKGLTKLLDRINYRQAQGILCVRWDRLTRSYGLYSDLKTLFRKYKIEVITLQSKEDYVFYIENMWDIAI